MMVSDKARLCPTLRQAILHEWLLTEAAVVNPQEVDKYAARFAKATKPQAGKDWFAKKLRQTLLNTPSLLRPVSAPSSAYPDYANNAITRGEPVFQFEFDLPALAQIEHTFVHLVDWFNALHEVSKRKPTNPVEQEDTVLAARELSKIMHYNAEQAVQHADQWFQHMGTRVKGTKTGVEVIMNWPNGFYAVRYTDQNTMMRDGQDLQNCLQHGYYKVNGPYKIYGIRKPNDEAVVGIRVGKGGLEECKGKNNHPVNLMYQSYVIDLLNHMQTEATNNHDLESADIHYHNGKYGGFEAVADVVYDEDGLKIWRSNDRLLAVAAQERFSARILNGSITSIDAGNMPPPMMIKVLNIIALPLPPDKMNGLERLGISYNSKTRRYGTLADVGEVIGRWRDFLSLSLGSRYVLVTDEGKVACWATNENDKLADVTVSIIAPVPAMVMFFNSIKLPPDTKTEVYIMNLVVYDGERYGSLKDIGTVIDVPDYGAKCWQIGKQRKWIVETRPYGARQDQKLLLKGGNLLRIMNPRRIDGQAKVTIRHLIREFDFKRMDPTQIEEIGGINLEGMIALDGYDLLNHLDAVKSLTTSINGMPFANLNETLSNFLAHNKTVKASPAQIAAIGKHLLPKEVLNVRVISRKHNETTGAMVGEVEFAFPVAALELAYYFRPAPLPTWSASGDRQASKSSLPKNILMHLVKGLKQAEAFMAKHPYMLVNVNSHSAPTPFYTTKYDEFISDVYKHNEAAKTSMNKMLSDDPALNISSRFALLNAMRKKT